MTPEVMDYSRYAGKGNKTSDRTSEGTRPVRSNGFSSQLQATEQNNRGKSRATESTLERGWK